MPLNALFLTCFFLYPGASARHCGLCGYESAAGAQKYSLSGCLFQLRKLPPLRSVQFGRAIAKTQKKLLNMLLCYLTPKA
jgi:hypothetical protein